MRIDDMKPGPEMDAEVAKLFGWKYQKIVFGEIVVRLPDGDFSHPRFSTTWEGMRLVVEEMQRRGWDYTLEIIAPRVEHEIRAQFGSLSPVSGETATHATVLAAIKALQGEDATNEKNG